MIKVEFEYIKEFIEFSEGYYNESEKVVLTDMGIWVDIHHVIEYLGYDMKDFSDLFEEWDSYVSGKHGEVEFI